MKYLDTKPDVARKIRKQCRKVRDVARVIQDEGPEGVRSDWESIMLQKMDEALHYKFTQHPEALETLLATGDRRFLFLSRREPFWGATLEGIGDNQMGLCLERVRERLRHDGAEEIVRNWRSQQVHPHTADGRSYEPQSMPVPGSYVPARP